MHTKHVREVCARRSELIHFKRLENCFQFGRTLFKACEVSITPADPPKKKKKCKRKSSNFAEEETSRREKKNNPKKKTKQNKKILGPQLPVITTSRSQHGGVIVKLFRRTSGLAQRGRPPPPTSGLELEPLANTIIWCR